VAAVPLALLFLVIAHLMALHEVGSNNPGRHRDQGSTRTPTGIRSTASRSIRTTR
jgi:quinol-cytochrome oxidoreductase complex cytochrome b subunit